MKCRYRYEDYPLKNEKQSYENTYHMEELYVINEDQEYQDLLKQIEEVNLEEVMMNIESRGSNNQVRTTQASSTSGTERPPVTLTSIERTSRTTQPLQPQTSYEFTQFPEQTYRQGKGKPDPLEVIKTMPKQNNEGSMLILSTVHPQKWT